MSSTNSENTKIQKAEEATGEEDRDNEMQMEQHAEEFTSAYVDGDDVNASIDDNVHEGNNDDTDNDLGIAPVKPKRPKSAYFIFMNEKRAEVREKFPTWGIGQIGKELGRLWGELSDEEREGYKRKCIPLVEQYEKDLELYNHKLKLFEAAKFGPDGSMGPPRIMDVLPTARVRKIMKLDKEVKGTSKEATLLVQWCTELFLGQITDEAYSVCKKQRKKMIKYEDISATVRKNEQMLFLAQDFPPINRRSKVVKKTNRVTDAEKEQSNTINKFFAPVAKSEISNVNGSS